MNIPEKINICGREWRVVFSEEEFHEDRRGSSFKELQLIKLNNNMHKELQETTLVHEILHACADFIGTEGEKLTEEEWIRRISPTLTQVIKQNFLNQSNSKLSS